MVAEALAVIVQQFEHNPWFRRFAQELNFSKDTFEKTPWWNWPYIPIEAFKDIDGFRTIDNEKVERIFLSSGTNALGKRAKHYVRELGLYKETALKYFHSLYPQDEFTVLAYLPAYSDNPQSSLLSMVYFIIESDQSRLSRFIDVEKPSIPSDLMDHIIAANKRILLFGAAFGLVEWVEKNPPKLPEKSIIMETGGMKTFRKEMSRTQIKKVLSEGFGIQTTSIHSEYGMCELLSQAYEQGDGWYRCAEGMHVFAKDENEPFSNPVYEKEAQLYVIDLANKHSCSFIQLQDRGIVRNDGSFQVLGRLKSSDLRGCNFLMEQEV